MKQYLSSSNTLEKCSYLYFKVEAQCKDVSESSPISDEKMLCSWAVMFTSNGAVQRSSNGRTWGGMQCVWQ